jgi:hypothetical protein
MTWTTGLFDYVVCLYLKRKLLYINLLSVLAWRFETASTCMYKVAWKHQSSSRPGSFLVHYVALILSLSTMTVFRF